MWITPTLSSMEIVVPNGLDRSWTSLRIRWACSGDGVIGTPAFDTVRVPSMPQSAGYRRTSTSLPPSYRLVVSSTSLLSGWRDCCATGGRDGSVTSIPGPSCWMKARHAVEDRLALIDSPGPAGCGRHGRRIRPRHCQSPCGPARSGSPACCCRGCTPGS